MSYADVVGQMQAIQAQLAQLGMLAPSPSGGASASASSFATALDGASSTPAVSTSSVASADGGLVSPNGVTGDDVVNAAMEYQGVPYVLGGESKSGIDCSGLVQAAFSKLGVSVPRLVHEQKVLGEKVDSLRDAKPGDLIVLNGGDHIAVYLGHDTVIHAPYPGRTVSVQKAWFTDKDITAIRRIVPATGDAGSPAASPLGASTPDLTGASTGTPSGLSKSAALKATAMLTTYGADVGLYDPSSSSSSASGSSGASLSSVLASFGLTGTGGAAGTSSTSAQQIIAARAALLGAVA